MADAPQTATPAGLEAARVALGCDRQEFADQLGVSRTQLWRMLEGQAPIRLTVAKLAALLVERAAERATVSA